MHTRIAPTPSGFLHIGNAFSFLLTQRLAQKQEGKILLRIDDSDADRKRPEYVQDIFDSLHWLGIEWQEGPRDPEDFENNWSQKNRVALYDEAIAKLRLHKHVFACSCSRKQLQEQIPCECRSKNIPYDTPETALRLYVPEGTEVEFTDEHLGMQQVRLDETVGSFVIRRRDGIPAYQLISLIDDLHFGIDYIVRGADLLTSTAAQLFLAEKLGGNHFYTTKFFHHLLLPDEHGQKLSKSEGALSLKSMRENGMRREDILQQLASLLKLEE